MPAPKEVLDLVERFHRNRETYENQHFNEAETRIQFLNPLFKALGWDVDNTAGYAEAYKDVIHEDAVKVGGVTKAPDNSFRIGGARKFFLEAKKPAVDIKDDADPAYQLRRYAWSAKLPVSVLSNFVELAVYDCRAKPSKDDKASKSRIYYCTCEQYEDKWDEIASIFSKDAILKGSFDKFAASSRNKRGTAEVDDEFLNEIEEWRDLLAKNIALRNPKITQRELNFAVQQTIDRVIFLRICEDRGIEPYGRLQALQNGENSYERLKTLFHQADDRYNSGLFHFREEKDRKQPPDELTLSLKIDDKPLKDIFRRLYYPDSPYEFSVLSADILGQVYEQFLGKVIRLTAGGHAKVEDKPEVKKAGGVYYTPTYIVDYIVKQTVGKLLEGKTTKTLKRLTVLDPACGSGSFLLGAYQYLLDWYLKQYVDEGAEAHAKGRRPKIFKTEKSGWRLTTGERKRILLEHIYGVDIDPQAVEVTKLSLLLKVLEEESAENLNKNWEFFQERALPDLESNIKCGNSLIGPDFYQQQQMTLLDEEERYRVNVFDWHTEFPEIFKAGGFDAVIGNPPWGALLSEPELEYLRQTNREIIVRMIDSFMYFVYQGSTKLNPRGLFGMILPDVILYQTDNQKLREFILNEFRIHCILNMGDVFNKVTRPACILIIECGRSPNQMIDAADLSKFSKADKPAEIQNKSRFVRLAQGKIREVPGSLFVTSNLDQYVIWTKVQSVPNETLESLVDEDGIQRGVSPDLKEAFLVDSKTAKKQCLEMHKLREVLTGGTQVKRYFIERPDLLLIYTNRHDNFRELPNIRAHVDQFEEQITCKEVKQHKHPLYALHRARNENIFLKKRKLLGVITEDEIVLAQDDEQTFATDGLYLFGIREPIDSEYVMGILNSRLFVCIYRLLTLESGRVLAQVKPTVLAQLPIRVINFSNKSDKSRHDQMVKLVEQMLGLHKRLSAAKTPLEKTSLERQIAATDAQIDCLVYDLYGLTEDEIKIVEGTA